jgi:hypothetical protein
MLLLLIYHNLWLEYLLYRVFSYILGSIKIDTAWIKKAHWETAKYTIFSGSFFIWTVFDGVWILWKIMIIYSCSVWNLKFRWQNLKSDVLLLSGRVPHATWLCWSTEVWPIVIHISNLLTFFTADYINHFQLFIRNRVVWNIFTRRTTVFHCRIRSIDEISSRRKSNG